MQDFRVTPYLIMHAILSLVQFSTHPLVIHKEVWACMKIFPFCLGDVAALVWSNMSGSIPFQGTIQQIKETMTLALKQLHLLP